MRKPGFGQRPSRGRPGGGGSGEGRGFGGKRPGAGGGGKGGGRFEGRGERGRDERRGEGRAEGDRKTRFSGDGGGKGPGSFKPRDGKRPFKRDGDRPERAGGGDERGGFRKGPRPFRHGEDRGEYSSKPPRDRDGFKKRPFRKDGEGENAERGAERGERRFEGKPRFERKGPPRERFGGEGERREGGPRREGWKPREDRGPRDRDRAPRDGERTTRDAERGGETRFKTRSYDKGKRPFEARGDRPERGDRPHRGERGDRAPRRDDRPNRGDRPDRGDRPFRGDRSERGERPHRSERPQRGEREDRFSRERPPVARLLPDRDEQALRSQRPQDFKKREHEKRRERESVRSGPAVLEPMRIAKAMARAGLCSRREAERWIEDGRVSINGEVLKTAAYDVQPKDRVLVDGKPLPAAEPPQLWRYYKPKGLVTTHHDPEGRPTVFDNLPPELPRVVSVGRLDFNTEGLILLTNDGELARHLELPATGWLRRYRVRAKGRVEQAQLDTLKEGIEVDGVRYGPVEATLDSEQGANVWLSVGIREGKNREVRKVLGSLGLEVNRLIRISFGPFQLLDLKPGEVERVRRRVLFDQLGPQLAAELGIEMPEPVAQKPQKPKPQKAKPERQEEEPEWQLLEETDIDLDALEAAEDEDDAESEGDGDEAAEGREE